MAAAADVTIVPTPKRQATHDKKGSFPVLPTAEIDRFDHAFPGSSFPTLATLKDGRQGIVKMKGCGNSTASLIAEFVVNKLAASLGLPVPDAFLVILPAGFPWTFGSDEFDDIVQKSSGINLGLTFIEGATPVRLPSYGAGLDEETLAAMLAIDLLFHNVDRLPQSQNLLRDEAGKFWLIDHGSCLFLRSLKQASAGLDAAITVLNAAGPALNAATGSLIGRLASPALLNNRVLPLLPAAWLAEEGLDPATILAAIELRLQHCQALGLRYP